MDEFRGFLRRSEGNGSACSAADVFSNLPILETPRLILRSMRMSDAQDVYAFSKDPEVTRYVLWEPHRSVSDSRMYLRAMLRQYRSGTPCSYGIVLKATGQLIGTIGFMAYSEENRCAEVGYSIARWLWNKGLTTEALQAVIDMAFRHLNLHRLEAMHDTNNPASGRVMQKCGMRHEGTLRGKVHSRGRFLDVDMYAILREDWLKLRK